MSEESKIKIGNGNRGKVRTTEHKLAVSQAQLGRKQSLETRLKCSLSHKGQIAWNKGLHIPYRYNYSFISPEGNEYKNISNLDKFCSEFNLKSNSIQTLLGRNIFTYKGWKISRTNISNNQTIVEPINQVSEYAI